MLPGFLAPADVTCAVFTHAKFFFKIMKFWPHADFMSLANAFSHIFWSLMILLMWIWLVRIFLILEKSVRQGPELNKLIQF